MLASVLALLSAAAVGVMALAVPEPPPSPVVITATAGVTPFSGHCDHAYCEAGTSYCFYWAGITSYDILSGPVPGEVRTTLGPCDAAADVPAPTPTVS